MEATQHKLCSFYRTPLARFTESKDLGFEISHCATCLPTKPLMSTESWSLLLRLWCGARCGVLHCCTSSAETPWFVVAQQGAQVSPLSPQHPPKALQGRGEEELRRHTWGPCPRAGCACTKPVWNMSWCLPWPNRSSGEVNSGKNRETYFHNIGKTCLGFKKVNISVQNKLLLSLQAFLGRILSRAR